MAQYIDKAALVAEIKRRISLFKKEKKTEKWSAGASQMNVVSLGARIAMLEEIKVFLNTLEEKEVHYKPLDEDFERDAVSFCFDRGLNTTPYIAKTIAKHFYALGLNVSNPTSQNVQDLIEKYVSNHADCRWLDASELEKLLNDFVVEYDVIKNREYEQQCKCKSK